MEKVDFCQYLDCLGDDGRQAHRAALDASYQEAARCMSPKGLSNYLEGMRAMCSMGRGEDLVLTFIQETPGVAKEIGEDVIPDIVHSAMSLSSHTSGTVITLLISNLTLAAKRLGDAEVFRDFLQLIHQLAAKAPRGLRPMMENLSELLTKLTLGGLRRWALWGVQAHSRDLDGQMAYFGLKSDASKAILQQERRGTLFVDNQRKLNFYLRSLWGRAFFMRPTSGDFETRKGIRPFIEDWSINVPDAFDTYGDIDGTTTFRATVAHAAAHLVYTDKPISGAELSPCQMVCIGLFEDARIEHLAMADFPGLVKLWAPFFEAVPPAPMHEAMAYMLRASRMLLTGEDRDDDQDLLDLLTRFRKALDDSCQSNQISWDAGIEFYHLLTDKVGVPSLRVLENSPIVYRDDNRHFWDFDEVAFQKQGVDYLPASKGQVRRRVNIMEFVNTLDTETAGDDAQEVWVLGTELFPYEDEGVSYNEREGREPISEPFHYQEWDYRAQLHRPDWATVVERRAASGDPEVMDSILARNRPLASRLRHLVDAMQPQGVVRKRGFEEGEEIDLNAAVRAMIDIRRGVMPDPRINIHITRHIRDLSVLILLDLSESTNERVNKEDPNSQTILELTRDATGLLSWAIASIGDPFAVHGFASDGRHDVQYYRFKDFSKPYDDEAKGRLASMKGGLSTRMGAALRHAGRHLSQEAAQRRLVLLITDGEPADIDERDPQYLRHDAKKAVEELATRGIFTYCLTLDPNADQYVSRIFGANRYSVVDNIERLPERLPAIFAALTG